MNSLVYYNERELEDKVEKKSIKEAFSELKSHNHRKGDNEWLRDVIPKNKNTRISFKDTCDVVESGEENLRNIYKDYQRMRDYTHGTDLLVKLINFTFYDTYYELIGIMFKYLSKGLLNLSDNQVSKFMLQGIAYEFYALIYEICND